MFTHLHFEKNLNGLLNMTQAQWKETSCSYWNGADNSKCQQRYASCMYSPAALLGKEHVICHDAPFLWPVSKAPGCLLDSSNPIGALSTENLQGVQRAAVSHALAIRIQMLLLGVLAIGHSCLETLMQDMTALVHELQRPAVHSIRP